MLGGNPDVFHKVKDDVAVNMEVMAEHRPSSSLSGLFQRILFSPSSELPFRSEGRRRSVQAQEFAEVCGLDTDQGRRRDMDETSSDLVASG